MSDRAFRLQFSAELSDDRCVKRLLLKLAHDVHRLDSVLNYEVVAKLCLEGTVHPDHTCVLPILLGGDEVGLGNERHFAQTSENRIEDDLAGPGDEAPEPFHATHAVDAGFHLTDRDFVELGHGILLALKALGFPLPEVMGAWQRIVTSHKQYTLKTHISQYIKKGPFQGLFHTLDDWFPRVYTPTLGAPKVRRVLQGSPYSW